MGEGERERKGEREREKHLLEKMLSECLLTLVWQEWLPNNAGGSWLQSRTETLLCPSASLQHFLVFTLYRIYSNLEKSKVCSLSRLLRRFLCVEGSDYIIVLLQQDRHFHGRIVCLAVIFEDCIGVCHFRKVWICKSP